ncbi:PREDICTED: uncharacterized protein LOC104813711 [Tarenaya hassleriana]|uniref:uncharacterized protein LOC104813711 n=1 Tax=Tarenaya hassleriana TaxID=28532 RepID=UPI00053C5749|nr:PREDICTED: uncharacterized protein LOC104813711 [Tarenaya hassleriana]
MEGNFSQGGMVPGGPPYGGGFDLQGSIRVHHPNAMHHHQHNPNPRPDSSARPSLHEGLPFTMVAGHSCEQNVSTSEYNKNERGKGSMSDEDEPSFTEEGGGDGHNEVNKAKKGSPWQRVKWTDKMVKLLITAVSYIGEDSAVDCGGSSRRKFAVLQKKGKWKSVSKVMAERSYHVSPQQCEDKFNDLNKRYKKLNDMLGRGTSCQVVENPALLDVIDYLSEKEKDDVRKILSSKHLFYEEMCSYHNGNRLHLPHDPSLQRSLQLALRSRDDHDNDDARKHHCEDHDDEDHDMEADDHDDCEEHHSIQRDGRGIHHASLGVSLKRLKQAQNHEDGSGCPNPMNSQECSKGSLPESGRAAWLQKQWIESRSLQLEEQKLQIQAELLELEKQRFKWQRFSKKRDQELEKMRMENQRMKLENERMALELKRREMGSDL